MTELSPKLQRFSGLLVSFLEASRHNGDVTPSNPIFGHQICERYEQKFNIKVSGEELRKVINRLRCEGVPIAAVQNEGYFWALTRGEIQDSIDRLRGRARKENDAADGLDGIHFNGKLTMVVEQLELEEV